MPRKQVEHTIAPYFNADSRILILGTMPSPKSRELGFYYAHPQNRFWRVLAEVLTEKTPLTIEEKKLMLRKYGIALWDVLKTCEIQGADDNSIRNPIVNDISIILSQCPIQAIYTTGKKATSLYNKYCYPKTGMETIYLPSTSPANCARYSYDDLVKAYRIILNHLNSV
ncbi:MAG: DNA-deoxyinosine glycosylase [Peptococcaceae bacterium]|nr:DNA-deoxyinosine glycosylase [Peptococcaceae bacterium]